MRLKKTIAILLITTFAFTIAGCAASNEINPEINTDLLEDFGLTLPELEKKYGKAIKSEIDDSQSKCEYIPFTDYTYFFKENTKGYIFRVYGSIDEQKDSTNEDKTQPDDMIRVNEINRDGERIEFEYYVGYVGDLVLGVEKPLTFAELKEIFVVKDSHGGHFTFMFNKDLYFIGVGGIEEDLWVWHEDNDIIQQDSRISMRYHRNAQGFDGW